jgi:aminoglycoside phosphotransferase (APT) family kinase protein
MPNAWDADIEIGPREAAARIEGQFPELAPAHLEPIGAGWDNVAFLVNQRFVFRFPRRRKAVRFLEAEMRLLPWLADRLPLKTPILVYAGAATDQFPYPFAGHDYLAGIPAAQVSWTSDQRAHLAEPLGRFLAALHGLPLCDDLRRIAPDDEIDRAHMAPRAPIMIERLRALAPRLPDLDIAGICDRIADLAETPAAGRLCLVHGDLHTEHLLVNEQETGPPAIGAAPRVPTGVIDWGDCHIGDPALDLSIAFTFLPAAARPAFAKAYGGLDECETRRAQFRAIHYGVVLMEYGLDTAKAASRAAGAYALRCACGYNET